MFRDNSSAVNLCWFCGYSNHSIALRGYTIGNMVYSSPISVSAEMIGGNLGEIPEVPQWVWDHMLKDGLQICSECFRLLADRVGDLPRSYVESHVQRAENQLSDIADVDTSLKSWKEVAYPFGCWREGFPDVDVMNKFYSLSIGELFERGLRFVGRAQFGSEEFQEFLKRFSAAPVAKVSEQFLGHFGRRIRVSGGPPPLELATVRAVVYDVSIWRSVNASKSMAKTN